MYSLAPLGFRPGAGLGWTGQPGLGWVSGRDWTRFRHLSLQLGVACTYCPWYTYVFAGSYGVDTAGCKAVNGLEANRGGAFVFWCCILRRRVIHGCAGLQDMYLDMSVKCIGQWSYL